MTVAISKLDADLIAEITNLKGPAAERLVFSADIGNCTTDAIEWKFYGGGVVKKVRMPRVAFTFEREQPMCNLWLVEMTPRVAEIFDIADMALDADEIERHKKRVEN